MAGGARLLVIEIPVPPDGRPSPAKVHDLEMLVFTAGGRERTLVEYRALLTAAGLRLRCVLRTGTPVAILEAVRAARRKHPLTGPRHGHMLPVRRVD